MDGKETLRGIDPVIEAYKKDVDLTLIRENLKLTPTERLEKLMKLQEFAEELRRAGRELSRPEHHTDGRRAIHKRTCRE